MTLREYIQKHKGERVKVQCDITNYHVLADILEDEGYMWVDSCKAPTDYCPTNAFDYFGIVYIIINTRTMRIGWNDSNTWEEYVVASSFDDIRNGGCSVEDSLTTFLQI